MKKKELPVFSVILYIAAGLTAIGASFAAYNFIPSLIDAINAGFSLSENFSLVVYLCLSEFFVYYIYALALAGIAVGIQFAATAAQPKRVDELEDEPEQKIKTNAAKNVSRNDNDNELDEMFAKAEAKNKD
jgi:hypothetical protein